MKRGEVTAFLSLIFVLIVSFISAMLDAASVKTAGNLKRLDVDAALFSVFGEYTKELMQCFDIFAVDISYGTGEFKEENIADRLRYYGTGDMEHVITGIQYLTDEDGIGFRGQAVSYMENAYGLNLISGLSSQAAKWKELELKGKKAEADNEKADEEYKEALSSPQEPAEESEEPAQSEEPAKVEDPLAPLDGIKPTSLLSAVLPQGFTVSGRRIDKSLQPSGRTLRKGRGIFKNRADLYGEKSKLLFHEFLLKKCGNALRPSSAPKGALNYETEYIICGKDSDAANLDAAAKMILLIRLGANMIFLAADPERSAEAEAAALAASLLICIPAVKAAAKQLILFAWAYKESLAELRLLFSGKKISMIKKEWEWRTTLAEVLSPSDAPLVNLPEGDSGYEDFLRVLMILKNEKELTMRALDCVEQKMRYTEGVAHFRADGAMINLKVENTADIGRGFTYSFPGSFGYF